MVRQRIIILAGAVPAIALAVLGLLNATEVTTLSPEALGILGAAFGVASAFVVSVVRAVREEVVFVFLAGVAGLVTAVLTIFQALDRITLTDEQAGAAVTVVTIVTATIATALRAEVTSPAHVDALEARVGELEG